MNTYLSNKRPLAEPIAETLRANLEVGSGYFVDSHLAFRHPK
jgi:hypothetical protein